MCRGVIDWFRERPLERGLISLVAILAIIFILILTVAWATGINGQFKGVILKASASGSEGYTPDFEKNLTIFANTVKEYGSIALTFFGITFIGGIFDLRRDSTREGRLSRLTTKMIFTISTVFLFCFMCLHIYTLIYPYITAESDAILQLLNISLSLFVISVNLLLYTLILYLIMLISLPKDQTTRPSQ